MSAQNKYHLYIVLNTEMQRIQLSYSLQHIFVDSTQTKAGNQFCKLENFAHLFVFVCL